MGTYLTAAELREHVPGLPLSDDALDRIIDDIESEIIDRFGPVGVDVVERIPGTEDAGPITLKRKPASITSIVEELSSVEGESTRTLVPADYRVNGYMVERLRGGTYPASGWTWYGTVVTYRPRDDSATRTMAVVDAAKLELAHSGYISLRIGDYAESTGGGGQDTDPLEVRRTKLLRRRLAPRRGFVCR